METDWKNKQRVNNDDFDFARELVNPYKVLGIESDATDEQIKKAHRKKAKDTHPDKEGGSNEAFKAVQEAYETLSDPETRKRYDRDGKLYTVEDSTLIADYIYMELLGDIKDFEDINELDVLRRWKIKTKTAFNSAREQITVNREKIKKCARAIENLKLLESRLVKRNPDVEDYFTRLISERMDLYRNEARQLRVDIKQYHRDRAVCVQVKKILDQYEYLLSAGLLKDFDVMSFLKEGIT